MGAGSLAEATRLVASGGLEYAETGEVFTWKPARMVIPLSPALRADVEGAEYDGAVEEAAREVKLRLITP